MTCSPTRNGRQMMSRSCRFDRRYTGLVPHDRIRLYQSSSCSCMSQDADNWLKLAAEDYDTALYLFKGARHPYAVYFLCQAIEKLLKAAQIQIANRSPRKVHNLVSLANKSGLVFPPGHLEILEDLSKHYKRVRYRDISQAHYNTKAKVQPIIQQAQEIYQWIRDASKNH